LIVLLEVTQFLIQLGTSVLVVQEHAEQLAMGLELVQLGVETRVFPGALLLRGLQEVLLGHQVVAGLQFSKKKKS
jgi:hypothetical protein